MFKLKNQNICLVLLIVNVIILPIGFASSTDLTNYPIISSSGSIRE